MCVYQYSYAIPCLSTSVPSFTFLFCSFPIILIYTITFSIENTIYRRENVSPLTLSTLTAIYTCILTTNIDQ